MTILQGTMTDGTVIPVQVDAQGRLVAEGLQGPAGEPGPGVPSGTRMLFAQSTAPTGWTKSTEHNNKALRVVTGAAGSGGTLVFTAAFARHTTTGTVAGTALTEAQLPPHSHGLTGSLQTAMMFSSSSVVRAADPQDLTIHPTGTAGSGQTHTHGFTGGALDLDVQYVDVIIATKD